MPPPNDNFADAIVLAGTVGSHAPIDNTGATVEAGEPHGHEGSYVVPNNQSIWFKWTAPADISGVFFTTEGSTATAGGALDTTLAVYTGTSLAALTEVAANDDTREPPGDYTSRVAFNAVNGTTYYIQAGTYSSGTFGNGMVALSWGLPAAPPPNDDFADALAVSGVRGEVSGEFGGATVEAGEPDVARNAPDRKTVWYSWTAPEDGTTWFAITDPRELVALVVYTGTSLASLTDQLLVYSTGYDSIDVTAGTIYWLQVDANTQYGPVSGFSMSWSMGTPTGPEPFAFVGVAASAQTANDVGTNSQVRVPVSKIVPAGRFLVALLHAEPSRASPDPPVLYPYISEFPPTAPPTAPGSPLVAASISPGNSINAAGDLGVTVTDGTIADPVYGSAYGWRAGLWTVGKLLLKMDPNPFNAFDSDNTYGLGVSTTGLVIGEKPSTAASATTSRMHLYAGAADTAYPPMPDYLTWTKGSQRYLASNESGTIVVAMSWAITGQWHEGVWLLSLAGYIELESTTWTVPTSGTFGNNYLHAKISPGGTSAWSMRPTPVAGTGIQVCRRSIGGEYAVFGKYCIVADVNDAGDVLVYVTSTELPGNTATDTLVLWHADGSAEDITAGSGLQYWRDACWNEYGDIVATAGPDTSRQHGRIRFADNPAVWRDLAEMGMDRFFTTQFADMNDGPQRGDFGPEVAAMIVSNDSVTGPGRWVPRRVPNDLRANATVISGAIGYSNGTLVNCSRGIDEPTPFPASGGATAWWRWTSPYSGDVTFSWGGYGNSTYLPQIAVYHGSTLVGMATSPPPAPAYVYPVNLTFTAVGGETYDILVDVATLPAADAPYAKVVGLTWRTLNAAPVERHVTSVDDQLTNLWDLPGSGWTAVATCNVTDELRVGDDVVFSLDGYVGVYACVILEFQGVPPGAALALGGDGCGGTEGSGCSGCAGGSTDVLADTPWPSSLPSALVVAGNVARYGGGSGPCRDPYPPTGLTPNEAGFTFLDPLDTGLSAHGVGVYLQPSWKAVTPLAPDSGDPGLTWTPSHWWSMGATAVSTVAVGIVNLKGRLSGSRLSGSRL